MRFIQASCPISLAEITNIKIITMTDITVIILVITEKPYLADITRH